jgi:energy-coupling factor transport system permease protein
VTVSLTKNPLYLAIILLSLVAVLLSVRSAKPDNPWKPFIAFGLTFAFISIAYNILISHYGYYQFASLPAWIPIIGGPLTLEAAVFGLTFGMTFLCGIMAFAAFNMAVGTGELLRFLPYRLKGAATVISVALNFIPATVLAAGEISQAQTIRSLDYGAGITGRVRKAGAAFVPLIVTGLEKAVIMAESMESRAYGGRDSTKIARPRQPMLFADYSLIVAALIPVFVLGFCLVSGAGWLIYAPYPKLTAPGFSPYVGACISLLAVPAVIKR